MNTKLNLGDDFTNDENAGGGETEVAAEIKKADDKSEEENSNSAIDADGKKKEEEKEVTPEQELQGLLKTETELDGDINLVQTQIEAAKNRIRQKRQARREGRNLVSNVTPDNEDDTEEDLSDIDPETLKVLERFTKAKGLVPKSEIGKMNYQSAHKASEDNFYQSHPEYLPDNDVDDVLYNALKTELSLYAAPTDPSKISALFEKAHKAIKEQYPEKFKEGKKSTVTDETKKSSIRLRTQSTGGEHGGNSSSNEGKKTTTKSFSDKQVQALRDGGWSDADIKELTN